MRDIDMGKRPTEDMHDAMKSSKTAGVVCTVLGGTVSLWVITRFASVFGQHHTWAPPFARYEWVTLAGAGVAALLLIVGLVRLTAPNVLHEEETDANPKETTRID